MTLAFLLVSTYSIASDFGPLPAQSFGKNGNLSCHSKEDCLVPSQRAVQKVAEDFLNYSTSRLESLSKIEAEIRAGIEVYQLHSEEVFSSTGNSELKSFLEKGKRLYSDLLDNMGISSARLLVGGQSPFLQELKQLSHSLSMAEAQIINAKSEIELAQINKRSSEAYLAFRTKGRFESYKLIDQVKSLTDYYNESGSLSPWINNQLPLRLQFSDCPVKVRRIIKKLSPSLRFDKSSKPLQFDVFEEYAMTKMLVQNGRLLNITCKQKSKGSLQAVLRPKKAEIELQYSVLSTGRPVLPKL